MPQLGTDQEIKEQDVAVWAAEILLMKAKLRQRALKGEGLMQSGDSFPAHNMAEAMDELAKEFGSRNLRPF